MCACAVSVCAQIECVCVCHERSSESRMRKSCVTELRANGLFFVGDCAETHAKDKEHHEKSLKTKRFSQETSRKTCFLALFCQLSVGFATIQY